MAKKAIRDIRSVTVGTSSTFLLPERNGRILTVVGAPPPPVAPAAAAISVARLVSLTVLGNMLVYTPPVGATAIVTGWSWASVSTTAVVCLRLIKAGIGYNVDQGPANVWRNVNLPVANPDSAAIVLLTAGAVGETADVQISATSYNTVPRITLGFGTAAVLDQGLTIYSGMLPLILPGPALDSEIYAVADAPGRQVNVIDLFYP